MKRNLPIPGRIYTLAEIDMLDLMDSPHLLFRDRDNKEHAVQDSHLKDSLSTLPGWAETKWRYRRTTYEWCPLFYYASDTPGDIIDLLDITVEYGDTLYVPHGTSRGANIPVA